jgi:hypothetical protein
MLLQTHALVGYFPALHTTLAAAIVPSCAPVRIRYTRAGRLYCSIPSLGPMCNEWL